MLAGVADGSPEAFVVRRFAAGAAGARLLLVAVGSPADFAVLRLVPVVRAACGVLLEFFEVFEVFEVFRRAGADRRGASGGAGGEASVFSTVGTLISSV
ncbi:hypothetical protein [Chondromyces apiculatus]|uniref:hypothetical protein n=1 Tax=Chondromyces apiculatus TaxID=51 RepID=UPI0012DD974F|nr:hypothetical protein [Chondromyces apiculatus]